MSDGIKWYLQTYPRSGLPTNTPKDILRWASIGFEYHHEETPAGGVKVPTAVWDKYFGRVTIHEVIAQRLKSFNASDFTRLRAPIWPFLLMTSIYPCVKFRRYLLRRHRRRAGQCLACGYDLSHSPGRCPECGTEREAKRQPGGTPTRNTINTVNLS